MYHFQLSSDHSDTFLIYQSQQRITSRERRITPQPTQLEDSDKLNTDLTTLPVIYPSPQPQTFTAPLFGIKDDTPFSNGTMGGIDQRWSSEQIADFVRKLGFLDAEKEGGEKIKLFLHLNTVRHLLLL